MKWEVIGHSDVMYRAPCVNFYLSSELNPFLSMEKIIERGLLTWEEEWPHPLLMVISTSTSKSDTLLHKYLANLGTTHLLYTLCRPKQTSIKEQLSRLLHVAGARLRQIITGSEKFRPCTWDHNYKPDFSEYINSSTENIEYTSPPASPVFTMASSSRSSSILERPDGGLL